MEQKFIAFIPENIATRMESLSQQTKAHWGVMGAQHMIEHLLTVFMISNEKIKFAGVFREETLPKRIAFLRGNEAFPRHVRIEGLPEDRPLPLRYADLQTARQHLIDEINLFVSRKDMIEKNGPVHPVFGPLGFDDWVRFHRKHLSHHFRQFGLI